jgi:cytochrome b561
MKKIQANALVDISAFIFFIPMTLTGIIIDLMNRGGGYEGGRNPAYIGEIFGMSKAQWIDIHTWTGYAFVILVLIHLLLHAAFIKNIIKYARGGQKQPEECED